MILELSVTNFRSIADEQFVSFEPSEHARGSAALKRAVAKHGALPVVAVFGANGAGKSTVVWAFRLLREVATPRVPDQRISAAPHKLWSSTAPTQVVVKLAVGEEIFEYSVALEHGQFAHEELRKVTGENREVVFRRVGPSVDVLPPEFEPLRGTLTEDLPATSSLLSHLAPQRAGTVRNVHRTLASVFSLPGVDRSGGFNVASLVAEAHPLSEKTFAMMRHADLGISAGRIVRSESGDSTIRLSHTGAAGDCELSLHEESDGTLAALGLAPTVWASLARGGIVVLDEVGANLNHWVVRDLIETFQSPKTNPNHAQLLITSHDPLLLDDKLLRTDQMVMVDKDTVGASQLTAVSDFTDLPAGKLLRSYLEGRLGGAPRFRNLWANLTPVPEPTSKGIPKPTSKATGKKAS